MGDEAGDLYVEKISDLIQDITELFHGDYFTGR